MKHRYPKISQSLQFKRIGQNAVEITDILTEKKWTLNLEAAKLVKQLDGKTNPYSISTPFTKAQIKILIGELYKRGMLQKSNVRHPARGTFYIPLWEPKGTNFLVTAAFFLNLATLALFLPLLIIGIWTFLLNFWQFDFKGAVWGLPIGLVSAVLLHELSHIFTALAYGAEVREAGLTLQYYVLPGLYTVMDDKGVKKRLHRIHIHGAGARMNLFLAGLFLILGSAIPSFGGMLLLSAALNAFFALMHLMLWKNSDGAAILSELLGTEDIMSRAGTVVRSREERAALGKHGIHGIGTVGLCYVLFALQIVLPILLILNVLEVIAWIL